MAFVYPEKKKTPRQVRFDLYRGLGTIALCYSLLCAFPFVVLSYRIIAGLPLAFSRPASILTGYLAIGGIAFALAALVCALVAALNADSVS